MPRYTEVFKELNIQQKQIAEDCRIDEPTMSKIVHGRILPNKAKLQRLCERTQKEALDFYSRDEIDLVAVCRKRKPSKEVEIFYKITGRLLREDCGVLIDEKKLKLCGYDSIQHWLRNCLRRLNKQHEIITKYKAMKK